MKFLTKHIELGINWATKKYLGLVSISVNKDRSKFGNLLFRVLGPFINISQTNRLASATQSRPNTYSLKSKIESDKSYLDWESVTDKTYFSRHLAPRPNQETTSSADALFKVHEPWTEGKSNVLFMFFAQWFTDGFFRSDTACHEKTTSKHNVDLCQIYGQSEKDTIALRSCVDGKLLTYENKKNPKGLPAKLFAKSTSKCKPKSSLEYKSSIELFVKKSLERVGQDLDYDKVKDKLFATGLARGNLVVGNLAISTIFLREHNRICDQLIEQKKKESNDKEVSLPSDEWLFQTARKINIIQLIKITINDYINHIAGGPVFRFDPIGLRAESKKWFREPWVAAEFNLLYRWHSLVPQNFWINENRHSFVGEFGLFEEKGIDEVLIAAIKQGAGEISVENTNESLLAMDEMMLNLERKWNFASYNDYRSEFLKSSRLTSLTELTKNMRVVEKLSKQYSEISMEKISFLTGIYAEDKSAGPITGELQTRMVAYDAFTQLYTNPLLAEKNYTSEHLTDWGMKFLEDRKIGLAELIKNNLDSDFVDNKDIEFPFINRNFHKKFYYKDIETSIENHGLDSVLCPIMRIGVRLKLLNPDSNGEIHRTELDKFLKFLGWSPKNIISKILSVAAIKQTHKKSKYSNPFEKETINICRFAETAFDHGSSSGVINFQGKFSIFQKEKLQATRLKNGLPIYKERMDEFIMFATDDKFYRDDLICAAYSSDIKRIWMDVELPKAWTPPNRVVYGFFGILKNALMYSIRFLHLKNNGLLRQ